MNIRILPRFTEKLTSDVLSVLPLIFARNKMNALYPKTDNISILV